MSSSSGTSRRWARIALLLALLVLVAGCAAGPAGRWQAPEAEAAGFWPGLWHGALLVVSLIVSFFTDDVRIYESHNTGVAYDIGFVLGALAVYGGGCRVSTKRRCRRRSDDEEKLETQVKVRIGKWLDDEEDWGELGEKVEKRLKAKFRRWLEEDDGPEETA